MSGLWGDVRFALRSLIKHRSFTGAALVILALGIGLNTSVFCLVNGLLFRPFPAPAGAAGQRLHEGREAASSYGPMAYPDVESLRSPRPSPASPRTQWCRWSSTPARAPAPRWVLSSPANYFSVLGVTAAVGRVLTPDDARPGAEPVAVLDHDAWRRSFGSDPSVVGRAVRINGEPVTIVGVAEAGFKGSQSSSRRPSGFR